MSFLREQFRAILRAIKGNNFENVFFEKAILKMYYLREQF